MVNAALDKPIKLSGHSDYRMKNAKIVTFPRWGLIYQGHINFKYVCILLSAKNFSLKSTILVTVSSKIELNSDI